MSILKPTQLSEAEALLAVLREQFPKAFFSNSDEIRPLKINIHKDLQTALTGQYSKKAISRALQLYVGNPAYTNALKYGTARINLAGNISGEVTAEHVKIAVRKAERMQKAAAKREELAKNPPPPLPHSTDSPITGKLSVIVTVDTLPDKVKSVKNGRQEFMVNGDGKGVKVTLRPRTWNKWVKALEQYPSWEAEFRGKIGHKIPFGGFELIEPVMQVYEQKEAKPKIVASKSYPPEREKAETAAKNQPSTTLRKNAKHSAKVKSRPPLTEWKPRTGSIQPDKTARTVKPVEKPALTTPLIFGLKKKFQIEKPEESALPTPATEATSATAPKEKKRLTLGLKKHNKE